MNSDSQDLQELAQQPIVVPEPDDPKIRFEQLFELMGLNDEYRGYDNPNAVSNDGPDMSD